MVLIIVKINIMAILFTAMDHASSNFTAMVPILRDILHPQMAVLGVVLVPGLVINSVKYSARL